MLRYPAILKSNGFSHSTLQRKIAQGEFTRPIEISERAVGIPEWEVAAINAARISGQSTAEIKNLVKNLMAARAWAKYFFRVAYAPDC
ncbi:AlpA family phage regulatory protein [Deefgea sp. CFH1-16]|nr:AlpA family phage regulatory protein [Deefgea sp. CFH1-16]